MQSITAFNAAIKVHRDQLAGDLTRQIICAKELAGRALMKSRGIVFSKLNSREKRQIRHVGSGYYPKRINRIICTVRFESSFIENHIVVHLSHPRIYDEEMYIRRFGFIALKELVEQKQSCSEREKCIHVNFRYFRVFFVTDIPMIHVLFMSLITKKKKH